MSVENGLPEDTMLPEYYGRVALSKKLLHFVFQRQ